MRQVPLLPLAIAALMLAACGAESRSPRETATSVTDPAAAERDLTLRSPATPVVEIASPVELSQPTPPPRPARRAVSRQPAKPVPPPLPVQTAVREPPTPPTAVVTAAPLPVEEEAAGAARELAPGKTVTAIPVSSGTSYAPEADESWLPSGPARGIVVGGGDTCRRRGGVRGIGIAGRIPAGIPRHRLR